MTVEFPGGAPLEAWYRDAFYEQPDPILDCVFGADRECSAIRKHREFPCGGGRIDLLLSCVGTVKGRRSIDHVVVEFKRAIAGEDAIAQVLRYVGCLRTFGDYLTYFHPVVCAPQFTENARWAGRAGGVLMFSLKAAVDIAVTPDLGVAEPSSENLLSQNYALGRIGKELEPFWYDMPAVIR